MKLAKSEVVEHATWVKADGGGAIIRCPVCSKVVTLPGGAIDKDGNLEFNCPADRCTAQASPFELQDWEPGVEVKVTDGVAVVLHGGGGGGGSGSGKTPAGGGGAGTLKAKHR